MNLLGLFRAPDENVEDARADGRFHEEHFRWLRDWGFNFARLPMDYRFWIVDGDWEKIDESAKQGYKGNRRPNLDQTAAF